jgi:hypothetical protein
VESLPAAWSVEPGGNPSSTRHARGRT